MVSFKAYDSVILMLLIILFIVDNFTIVEIIWREPPLALPKKSDYFWGKIHSH